jgi:hypothetical protein
LILQSWGRFCLALESLWNFLATVRVDLLEKLLLLGRVLRWTFFQASKSGKVLQLSNTARKWYWLNHCRQYEGWVDVTVDCAGFLRRELPCYGLFEATGAWFAIDILKSHLRSMCTPCKPLILHCFPSSFELFFFDRWFWFVLVFLLQLVSRWLGRLLYFHAWMSLDLIRVQVSNWRAELWE